MFNILSFDLEEYFHAMAFTDLPSSRWKSLKPRITWNMGRLLSVLGDQKATFFVVGWIAENYPALIKELHNKGHEIACHGFAHKSIWDMSPLEFKDDLLRAKETLEETINAEVIGFRAPNFSITRNTYWAIDIIQKAGFKYDSSIFPIVHDRYGIPDAYRLPHEISDGFWEIPLSTINWCGLNIPFGGGGYLRLYPLPLTNHLIRKMNREGSPAVIYQHPWELDDARVSKPKSFLSRIRRGLCIGKTEDKLKKLLCRYNFIPINEWLKEKERNFIRAA